MPLPHAKRVRRLALVTGAALALVAAAATASTAQASPHRDTATAAATALPCDIYRAGGTPCVAAHSTTRALYAKYNGPLYQVQRASDGATRNIGLLSRGGYVDAAQQDAFCAETTCVITKIYDQSGHGNTLTQAPPGGFNGPAAGGYDNLANATAAPVRVNGHEAYGVYIAPGTGYRDNNTEGIATGDEPEGIYAVLDGTHYNGGCCFDYGNAETDSHDDGNGTMEAVYFGDNTVWGTGTGAGPWIMADLEDGLFSGANTAQNNNDPSIRDRFLTAMVEGTSNLWAIRGGNAQTGDLSTFYDGTRPNQVSGYNPMHKQGAIILGIGGDNSNGAEGTFYEGVMTSGYPSEATERAVQANIATVHYTAKKVPLAAGRHISLRATTPGDTTEFVTHDDDDDGVAVAPVTASSSRNTKLDASWVETAGLGDSSCVSFESVNEPGSYLRHEDFQFHLQQNDGTAQFASDATFCPAEGNSGTGTSFASINFPSKYLRNYEGKLDLASDGGSNPWDTTSGWVTDSTWNVVKARASVK